MSDSKKSPWELNSNTLLHTAGSIRLALQDLSTALEAMGELPELRNGPGARNGALAMRSLYTLSRTAAHLELFARLREGSYPLRPVCLNVRAQTEALCGKAAELLTMAGIKLRWRLPAEPLTRSVDWDLASALLWELLNNAAGNSPDGKLLLELREAGPEGMRFVLTNRAEALPEDLFQRHAAQREELSPGLGLGLSILSMGSQLHGGSFLLLREEGGLFTAALSLGTPRQEGRASLCSPILLPATSLDPGLTALSNILPVELYRMEDLL